MVNGIYNYYDLNFKDVEHSVDWGVDKMLFAVREPFLSKTTSTSLCFGEIQSDTPLEIESQMPENGIVFSDGMQSDAIQFTTGTTVKIGIAKENANLVV